MVAERGFPICDVNGKLVPGPEVVGRDNRSVDIPLLCPLGGRPVGTHHTHPGGSTRPSKQDLSEAGRLGLDFICITVPEKGRTECTLLRPS